MSILSLLSKKTSIPGANEALPGRTEALQTAEEHFVNHHS